MSNLTFTEKRKLEQLLGMKTGYVLDFSDRTFAEFVSDATGLNIFDERYNYASGSKANRLRAFWQKEDNATVGKLMGEVLNYSEQTGPLAEVCRLIVARLLPRRHRYHSGANASSGRTAIGSGPGAFAGSPAIER
jgi:hypothetical protein